MGFIRNILPQFIVIDSKEKLVCIYCFLDTKSKLKQMMLERANCAFEAR